jgi:hypothetical protein
LRESLPSIAIEKHHKINSPGKKGENPYPAKVSPFAGISKLSRFLKRLPQAKFRLFRGDFKITPTDPRKKKEWGQKPPNQNGLHNQARSAPVGIL